MSVNLFRIIPADPQFVPTAEARSRAKAVLRSALPEGTEISDEVSSTVTFFDAGELTERTACPFCLDELTNDWWLSAMDAAYQSGFTNLAIQVPCCGKSTTLNDLVYHWPMGFGRYMLEARDPNTADELAPEVVRNLEEAIGCSLRQCWARY